MRISTRLQLIIATCMLPALALYAVIGYNLWTERKAQLADLAVRQAELLAADLSSISEGARILLAEAGEFHQIRSLGDDCSSRLGSVQRLVPSFRFLVYLDVKGQIKCASDTALIGRHDDAISVEAARSALAFTAGRFARSKLYPDGIVPFYFPLLESGGDRTGTLVAGLSLDWLEQHLHQLKRAGSPFLSGGVLTIADADGIVLARDVRHSEFVGKQFPPAAMSMIHATAPGILRMKSMDGTVRLVGYTPPTSESHNLAVAVGFYEPELMDDLKRALLHWGLLLLGVTVAAFSLTMLAARYSITRPTQHLLGVAKRWQAGDLSARTPIPDERSEFGQIAAAFNVMAAALQGREDKLRLHATAQERQVAQRTHELTLINERLRREIEEHRATETALLQAQKVQVVGQLAGGIAHDFNNILQTISGSAGLLQRRAEDKVAVRRLGTMIEDAARRGTSITRRLLAFSRREELRAETLDLNELVSGLHEVLAATLGVGIQVDLNLRPDLPAVHADRGQLETVLLNLATNARDAMPNGGHLRISVAVHDHERPPPAELPSGRYVSITVSDTGHGMDPDTIARASEPFFTTKPLGQGTGLGLAMARSFSEGSGGKLIIESELGRGTRVYLWLPAIVPNTKSQPAQPAPVRRCPSRPVRILLVDDDPHVREVLASSLTDEGYDVLQAGDVPSALTSLTGRNAVDVLVTDLAMPGPDGLLLIREAQYRQPELPAILITGYAGSAAELAVGLALEGRFVVLRKPIAAAHLADQIAALTSHLHGAAEATID